MITLMAIVFFVMFLKVVGLIFGAGLRILGWLLSGAGFIISVVLAMTVIGLVFDVIPILLIIGVIMMAMRPVR